MKIPKKRAIRYIAEDGNTYIKEMDIPFPLLSYLLGAPVRFIRAMHFLLQIRGVLPIRDSSKNNDSDQIRDQTKQSKTEQIIFGHLVDAMTPFQATINNQKSHGNYRVRYAHVDEDMVDGSDVLEFIWKTDEDDEHKTYHMPDYFLRLMFSEKSGVFGSFITDIDSKEREAFSTHLLVHEAKALIDDRTYEEIRISGHNYEIRLKYMGLLISLAHVPGEPEYLLALMSGVMGGDDILELFVARIPITNIAASSTAAFDAEEKAWVNYN